MKKKIKSISQRNNKRAILALVGVVLIAVVFIWLGFEVYNARSLLAVNIRSISIIEQGDTRIQQEIHLGTYGIDKKCYICTYIEVYNNGWREAERWHDLATAGQVAYVKAMQRELAEKAGIEIGKAVREFHYGKESE